MDKFCEYYAKRRGQNGLTLEESPESLVGPFYFLCCLSRRLRFWRPHGRRGCRYIVRSHSGAACPSSGPNPGCLLFSSFFILITDKPRFGDNMLLRRQGLPCSLTKRSPQQFGDISVRCV
jgi:hypothetical protein